MRVLEVIDGYSFGGIAKVIEDLSNNIENISFDFLTATNINNNWNMLNVDRRTLKGKIVYNYRLYKYLKKNKYDIVHINSAAFFYSFQVVLICKMCKIKKIIVHSHGIPNIIFIKKILIRLLNPLYIKLTDVQLSCSKNASKSLYTNEKNVIILKNGVDVNKYKYNEKIRNKIRKKLNIENKIVYGHVGRFEKEKNHYFLIDLFYELQKNNDSVLLLVGTGSLENKIKDKVINLGIQDKVIFLGFKDNIGELLCAMDLFIFPSLCEGLGISVIEAQTSGLPTVVSSCVPEEANISDRFIKIFSYNKEEWVKQILKIGKIERKNCYKDTIKHGYDIKKCSKELEKIYKKLNEK